MSNNGNGTKVLTQVLRWYIKEEEVHLDKKKDEAEKLSQEYAASKGWPTKAEWLTNYKDGLMAYEIRYEAEEAFEAGYRAGVASREPDIDSKHSQVVHWQDCARHAAKELTALREENEKLKEALHYETLAAQRAVNLHDECFKKYNAEKLKSQKLVEACRKLSEYYDVKDSQSEESQGFLRALAAYANNESGNEG